MGGSGRRPQSPHERAAGEADSQMGGSGRPPIPPRARRRRSRFSDGGLRAPPNPPTSAPPAKPPSRSSAPDSSRGGARYTDRFLANGEEARDRLGQLLGQRGVAGRRQVHAVPRER